MSNIFGDFDLSSLKHNSDFKEDSVREVIILPILKALGYTEINIVRSKTLQHPFLKIGSKKRPINLIPDYVLKVENNFAWVLDAKAPNENIKSGDHIEQVYSYATHPEIRSNYFALCNGVEFSIFKTTATNIPVLFFSLDEIEYHWEKLTQYLSPNSFQSGKNFSYETTIATAKPKGDFDYNNRPLLAEIPVKKQSAKRHFGVHGYFTKQAWNVVAEYIKNFSQPGDLILDPFGGSGVTAIEALMNNRKAISTDINPMAVFIVNSLIAPVDFDDFSAAFERVKTEYQKKEPTTEAEIQKALTKYPYPQGLQLPKGSDVETVEQLFSDKQLAQLCLLKSIIKKEKDKNIRDSLMLMFSGLLNKINLTYHASEGRSEGRGNSSVFAYYRYRIAKEPASIEILPYLQSRFKKVSSATAFEKRNYTRKSNYFECIRRYWRRDRGRQLDTKKRRSTFVIVVN
ncbi:MAG: hypothetical protein RLZZ507_3368 [Cyanobacteriota bacterium]|jgi:hypothetical protein